MFRIKICGITNIADAVQAIEAGADALGFNFFPKSPRFIDLPTFQKMTQSVQLSSLLNRIKRVGVFVNHANPLAVAIQAGLNTVQLHGDELPADVAAMIQSSASAELQVWRAFRCREANLSDVASYLKECNDAGHLPHAVLLDAYAPDAFGGTGKVVDWNAVREHRDQLHGLPVILAGGLTPDNVAQAIRTARPDAVDVASGVESSPGKKDPAKVRDFIAVATAAFAEIA